MRAYTVPGTERTVQVGDVYRDAQRPDARTLQVTEITGPYRDWRGIERCRVQYTVLGQLGGKTPSALPGTILADQLTDPARFVLVGAVS